jgi:hypothetical protein
MRKLFLLMLCAFVVIWFSGIANSDPTVTEGGTTVEVSEIDADFTYSTSCMMYGRDGSGVRMDWILFIPGEGFEAGTAGCYVSIKEGTDSGPLIFYSQESDAGLCGPSIIYFNGSKIRPVIDFSASSVGHDSSKVIFKLWPEF